MKSGQFTVVMVAMALSVALPGCDRNTRFDGSRAGSSGEGATNVYSVKGVLRELGTNGRTATITHEEIPGYMKGMTMDFDVKDTNALGGLKPGDVLSFRLVVTRDDGWIDHVTKIGSTNLPPPREEMRRAPIVEPLNIGDAIPDYKFTNQLGQGVSLHQFRGKALAITFFFTRCGFPAFCPRMSGNFAAVQQKLKAMPGAPRNWHLLSISFDPANDTPEVLKKYGEGYGCDPASWSFLTTDLWNLDGITEQVGLQFWTEEGTISHNLKTVIVDRLGRVQRVFSGNAWTPDELIPELLQAAAVRP